MRRHVKSAKSLQMKKHIQRFASSVGTVALAWGLAGCGDKPSTPTPVGTASEGKPAAAMPAVPVTTVPAVARTMVLSLEATGTVTPVSAVDVKPQIGGVITQVHVKEGQQVGAGQLLFTLDTRADEANVARMRAQIVKDEALLADAQRQLVRARDLFAKNFISQGSLDTNQANVDSLMATLNADKASLDAARVPLAYGQVRAASAGRIGIVPVFAGTAVQANITTLTTLTQLNPIDVSFNLPQAKLPELLALQQSGKGSIKAALPDGQKTFSGQLHFVDSMVDAGTGTVKAKARFQNPDAALWPGAFVKVALQTRQLDDAVVVPLNAIIQSPRGAIVYVADNGKAALKPVKVLGQQGDAAAVSGVNVGDKVVVEGRQNLRPDAPLTERPSEGAKGAKEASGDNSKDKAAP